MNGLANRVTLNFYKTNHEICYQQKSYNLNIGYDDKTSKVETTKFLGQQTDNLLRGRG
jgi:hypothetical protein